MIIVAEVTNDNNITAKSSTKLLKSIPKNNNNHNSVIIRIIILRIDYTPSARAEKWRESLC